MQGDNRKPESTRAFFSGWWDFAGSVSLTAKITLGVLAWVSVLAAWEFLPRPEGARELVPTASQVASALSEMFAEKEFASDVGASLKRIAISFVIAIAVAWPLGIAMGAFPAVEALLNPIVSPLRYLPAPSFVPLLLALLGTGDEQKIALLVIGVIWFLVSLLMEDTKRVPRELLEASRTLGASRLGAIQHVIVPSAMPFFLDTMRQMLAVSWTYLVIAEIVAATDGIGAVMMRARRLVRMDVILGCILTIGALGLVSDVALRGLRRIAFPYLNPSKT